MIEDEFLDECDLCLVMQEEKHRYTHALCRYHWAVLLLWVIMDLGQYRHNSAMRRSSQEALDRHHWLKDYTTLGKPLYTIKEIEQNISKDWTNGKLLLAYLKGEVSFPTREEVRAYGRNEY